MEVLKNEPLLAKPGRSWWRTRKEEGLFLVHRAMDEPIILHHCWHREHPLRFSCRRRIRMAIPYNRSWCGLQYKMDSVLLHQMSYSFIPCRWDEIWRRNYCWVR